MDNLGIRFGLDIGSTTIKCVVLDQNRVIFSDYKRHFRYIRLCHGFKRA